VLERTLVFTLVFILAGCKGDFECPDDMACIQRVCQNPCLFETCGINAFCKAQNHRAYCLCLDNFKGDPYTKCVQYECLNDPDCPDHLACRSNKCVDPCDCAQNADCSARNHKGHCSCRPGYTGDPYIAGCIRSKHPCVPCSYAHFLTVSFSFCYNSSRASC
jgi:hypothetical protein